MPAAWLPWPAKVSAIRDGGDAVTGADQRR
jgi:hypothetical protein